MRRIDCEGNRRCGIIRRCERCARIRAAKVADRAERLETDHGRLAFMVLKPEQNTGQSIRQLRDRIVRAKIATTGIWTVETGGIFAGLHLNIIAPEQARDRVGVSYSELIKTSTRAAASYICKREGMPDTGQYSGHLLGGWGSPVAHLMKAGHGVEIVQAAAVQMALGDGRQVEQVQQAQGEAIDYKAIAMRHLKDLYRAIGK